MLKRKDVLAPEQLEALERFKEVDIAPGRFPPSVRGPHWVPGLRYPVFRTERLIVMVSIDRLAGRDWLHVSYRKVSAADPAKDDDLPTHKDTVFVRETFFKPEGLVVAVFPPKVEYVNVDARVLHLWERFGADRLVPDLRTLENDDTRDEYEKEHGRKVPPRVI